MVKFFSEGHSLGDTGSNDTGLKFVSCRGAEKKGGHTHTDTQILGIIHIDKNWDVKALS